MPARTAPASGNRSDDSVAPVITRRSPSAQWIAAARGVANGMSARARTCGICDAPDWFVPTLEA
jgi:hypothetical protein